MKTISRRHFLQIGVVAPATLSSAFAIDPIAHPTAGSDIKLSLAAYSFRKSLDLKKGPMTLFDFIDLASTLPLDAVELTSYYFAETSDAYLDKLKAHAAAKKLAISGVPVSNNFCQPDNDKRKADIEKVKLWTTRAARLGAKTVRIFAGNLTQGDAIADAQKRVVNAIEECARHAEKVGILLALENHHGITATPDELLVVVKAVQSKAFGVNLDTGNFQTKDPYADMARVVPYSVVTQIKTEVFPDNKREEADLHRVVKILKDGHFHGYAALEYEAGEDPKTAVPRYIKELRKLIG